MPTRHGRLRETRPTGRDRPHPELAEPPARVLRGPCRRGTEDCGRRGRPGERDRILSWQSLQREYFAAHADAARKIAGDAADRASQASWTMVANVLLNLDEALTKEETDARQSQGAA